SAPPSSFYLHAHHRHPHSFPTRRSSDLGIFERHARRHSVGGRVDRHGEAHLRVEHEPAARLHAAHVSRREALAVLQRRHLQVQRSEEHTSELQSRFDLVCRLLLENKKSGPWTFTTCARSVTCRSPGLCLAATAACTAVTPSACTCWAPTSSWPRAPLPSDWPRTAP